ncbi:MAG: TIGR03364 family FAD-dependent oxidoreductase [Planctomycetaceae bacterium]|nr:TIGR03364 family FAD-dependent oxidoreductase [Planctomycetaceae bacterium]
MKTVESHSDLLVVGGGALGAFHAWHALQRGLSVTLLERNAAPRGATVRNFGQVVPSGLNREWQQFGRESLSIYHRIQSEWDISVRQQGSIYIASDDDELTLLEELREINREEDYPSDLWTPEQCRTRYPQLRHDYCRGGLFFPLEVSVNPRQMIHRLHRWLERQPSFRSCFRTSVQELTSDGTGTVRAESADGRVWTARKAVLCCGHEFEQLFPQLFRDSDLTRVKLQMLRLHPQTGVSLPGNILTGLSIRRYESFAECPSWTEIKNREPRDGFARELGVHILFKQESDGGIILGDSHEYSPSSEPVERDFELRTDVNDFFLTEARRIMDLPEWNVEASWYGVYCQTGHPSGIFTTTVDGDIHIATGIGGKGMTSSPGFSQHNLGRIWNA